jgi:hypothetical protein
LPLYAAEPARLVVVIDDLGNRPRADARALALPGAVALAILPGTPQAKRLARQAHAAGKTVLVHQPMQAYPEAPLGPYALRLEMSEGQFRQTLRDAVQAVPHASGLNNHMGSLLTRHPGAMAWVMQELADMEGWFFLDSRTTAATVTERVATENGVPWMRRHVFLDDVIEPEAVARQWQRALDLLQRQPEVVVIGHPNPETLDLLERELPRLAERGDIALVSPLRLIEPHRAQRLADREPANGVSSAGAQSRP